MARTYTQPIGHKGTPAKVADLLETDGSWLSSDALHHQISGPKINVLRALQKLHAAGFIEDRQVTRTPGRWHKEWRWAR